jgi:hypothetical protein
MARNAEFTYTLDKVRCIEERPTAIRCERMGKKFWIPQSVIHDDSEVYKAGTEGSLVVKYWFAEKEGWVAERESEPMDTVDGLKAIGRRYGR